MPVLLLSDGARGGSRRPPVVARGTLARGECAWINPRQHTGARPPGNTGLGIGDLVNQDLAIFHVGDASSSPLKPPLFLSTCKAAVLRSSGSNSSSGGATLSVSWGFARPASLFPGPLLGRVDAVSRHHALRLVHCRCRDHRCQPRTLRLCRNLRPATLEYVALIPTI
jgi:hypothetical protein